MKKLIQVTNNPLISGIFYFIKEENKTLPTPYDFLSNMDSIVLDTEYYFNNSGHKIVSPLIDNLLNNKEYLSIEDMQTLAKIIIKKYGFTWNKIYNTMQLEYNPIHNYNMTENEKEDITHGGSSTKTMSGDKIKEFNKTHTDSFDNYKEKTIYSGSEKFNNGSTKEDQSLTYGESINYEGTELLNDGSRTSTINHGKGIDTTHTGQSVDTQTGTTTTTQDNKVFGYDSEQPVNDSSMSQTITINPNDPMKTTHDMSNMKDTTQEKGTTEQTDIQTIDTKKSFEDRVDRRSGTDTNSTTITQEVDSVKSFENREDTRTFEGTRTLTDGGNETTKFNEFKEVTNRELIDNTTKEHEKSGNIGVTTTQKMITEERLLWSDWNWLKSLFNDIDNILTIGVYYCE